MFEVLRSGMLAGLGAAVVTKEKLDEMLDQLVEQGKVSSEEASKMREELLNSGEREWRTLQEKVQEQMRKAMDAMDLPSKTRVQALEERMGDMEKKLTALELKMKMEQ